MVYSIIAPYVTGWLADRTGSLSTGSLSTGFYLAGALLLLGMVSMSLAREQKIAPATAPKSRTVQART